MSWTITKNKIGLQTEKFTQIIPPLAQAGIYELCGLIRERQDGRWNWYRKRTHWFSEYNKAAQGTCETRAEARKKVLDPKNGHITPSI